MPVRHGAKGTDLGGQFIGAKSVARALIKMLSPGDAAKHDAEVKDRTPKSGMPAIGRLMAAPSAAHRRMASHDRASAGKLSDRIKTLDEQHAAPQYEGGPGANDRRGFRMKADRLRAELKPIQSRVDTADAIAADHRETHGLAPVPAGDHLAAARAHVAGMQGGKPDPQAEIAAIQKRVDEIHKDPSGFDSARMAELDGLQARRRELEDQQGSAARAARKPAPAFVPKDPKVDRDIRDAVASLTGRTDLPSGGMFVGNPAMGMPMTDLHETFRQGGHVYLADVRDALGEKYSRQQVDAALTDLATDPSVRLLPVAASASLSQRDRDSALRMGGGDINLIKIEPSAHSAPATPAPKKTAAAPSAKAAKRPPVDVPAQAAGPGVLDRTTADVLRGGTWDTPDTYGLPAMPPKKTAAAKMTRAKAATPDPAETVAAMRSASSRDEAAKHLEGRSVSDLKAIAASGGIAVGPRDTKPKLKATIVQWTAGQRLDSAAISRPGPSSISPGAANAGPSLVGRKLGGSQLQQLQSGDVIDIPMGQGKTARATVDRVSPAGTVHTTDGRAVTSYADDVTVVSQAGGTPSASAMSTSDVLRGGTWDTPETGTGLPPMPAKKTAAAKMTQAKASVDHASIADQVKAATTEDEVRSLLAGQKLTTTDLKTIAGNLGGPAAKAKGSRQQIIDTIAAGSNAGLSNRPATVFAGDWNRGPSHTATPSAPAALDAAEQERRRQVLSQTSTTPTALQAGDGIGIFSTDPAVRARAEAQMNADQTSVTTVRSGPTAAQKMTQAKAAVESPDITRAKLAAVTTREEARALLSKMTVAQLKAVNPEAGTIARNKADLIDLIANQSVGSRLDAAALTIGNFGSR